MPVSALSGDGWRERQDTMPRIPTPPPFILCRLEGMVGIRVRGPSPLREMSKRAIRQSVPARKVEGDVKRREEGV